MADSPTLSPTHSSSHDPSQHDSTYHPAFHAPNIKTVVTLVLDFEKVPYSALSTLFKTHFRSYNILFLIDPCHSPPPELSASLISQLDATVLKWLYATISDDLLITILDDEATALSAWSRLRELFQDNKESRAVLLEKQFAEADMTRYPSLPAYCQRLKSIEDQLKNIGNLVSEARLVLRLVSGLSSKYHTTAAIIENTSPLPSFAKAWSMLSLAESRFSSSESSHASVFVASSSPAVSHGISCTSSASRGGSGASPARSQRPSTKGRRRPTSKASSPSPPPTASAQPQLPHLTVLQWPFYAPWFPSMTQPPCPYPSIPLRSPLPPSQAGILGPVPRPPPSPALLTQHAPVGPSSTDLAALMQSLSL